MWAPSDYIQLILLTIYFKTNILCFCQGYCFLVNKFFFSLSFLSHAHPPHTSLSLWYIILSSWLALYFTLGIWGILQHSHQQVHGYWQVKKFVISYSYLNWSLFFSDLSLKCMPNMEPHKSKTLSRVQWILPLDLLGQLYR